MWIRNRGRREENLPEFLLSWKTNYLSWLSFFKKNPGLGLIIKYEDMVQEGEKTFLKISGLFFINHPTPYMPPASSSAVAKNIISLLRGLESLLSDKKVAN